MLDEAARVHPDTWWWIKADGVDLVSGLGESVRGIWSGDVDLADGALKRVYELHQQRLQFLDTLGTGERSDSSQILVDLKAVEQFILKDVEHISTCKFAPPYIWVGGGGVENNTFLSPSILLVVGIPSWNVSLVAVYLLTHFGANVSNVNILCNYFLC